MEIQIDDEQLENGEVFAVYRCPKCKKTITGKINWNEDYYKMKEDIKAGYIHICSCVSGGVYSVYFECPHCHEEISIKGG